MTWRTLNEPNDDRFIITPPVNGKSCIFTLTGKKVGEFEVKQPETATFSRATQYNKWLYRALWAAVVVLALVLLLLVVFDAGRHFPLQ